MVAAGCVEWPAVLGYAPYRCLLDTTARFVVQGQGEWSAAGDGVQVQAGIGGEHGTHGQTGSGAQISQLALTYEMAVADAVSAPLPVEKIVTRLHIIPPQTNGRPRQDLAPQPFTGQELPSRDDETASRAQERGHLPNETSAEILAGDVVEQSEGEHAVEALCSQARLPVGI